MIDFTYTKDMLQRGIAEEIPVGYDGALNDINAQIAKTKAALDLLEERRATRLSMVNSLSEELKAILRYELEQGGEIAEGPPDGIRKGGRL